MGLIKLSNWRRVTPSVIASQIVGCQPMTGPTTGFIILRTRYHEEIGNMQKKHYQHFIKVYNRRRRQKMSYLTNLGYTCVKIEAPQNNGWDAEQHCKKYVKDGAWIRNHSQFLFAYDKDVTLFALRFA
jgi:hypothetical protein